MICVDTREISVKNGIQMTLDEKLKELGVVCCENCAVELNDFFLNCVGMVPPKGIATPWFCSESCLYDYETKQEGGG